MTNYKIPQIGIDPGVSAGCLSIWDNGKIHNIRMPETFMLINEALKPFGGGKASIEQINSRPNFSPFANKRMEPLIKNVEHLKNAMDVNNISYTDVAPATWQGKLGLKLPKGQGEKGVDYIKMEKLKKELKHLKIHLSIETKTPNDELIVDNIRYILETSGKEQARKALLDDFTFFTKYDLNTGIKEAEKDIESIKQLETRIRKNRYFNFVQDLLRGQGYKEKLYKYHGDALCILLYQLKYGQ